MARGRSRPPRRSRGAAENIQGTLGSLLRSTLSQAGAVRDAALRQARSSRGLLEAARLSWQRRDALAELGEAVLERWHRGGLADLERDEEVAELIDAIDALDRRASTGESGARGWGRSRPEDHDEDEPYDDREAVSSADWRPPRPSGGVGVWRPVMPRDADDDDASDDDEDARGERAGGRGPDDERAGGRHRDDEHAGGRSRDDEPREPWQSVRPEPRAGVRAGRADPARPDPNHPHEDEARRPRVPATRAAPPGAGGEPESGAEPSRGGAEKRSASGRDAASSRRRPSRPGGGGIAFVTDGADAGDDDLDAYMHDDDVPGEDPAGS